jgi:hypothetical protein
MNSRVPDTHAEAWSLLPWLANGRLAAEDREWVEAHVHACAGCRAELEAQRRIASQVALEERAAPPVTATEEQRSFNKLWARIEAAESVSTPAMPITGTGITASGSRAARTVRWLAAAVVVQAIGLGILGVALRSGEVSRGAEFTTVSNAEARLNAPAVRIVFDPQASLATVNTLLTHQGLSIVSGPGAAGNYTAELSADAVAAGATAESVAAVISKDPHVSFAQPVAR